MGSCPQGIEGIHTKLRECYSEISCKVSPAIDVSDSSFTMSQFTSTAELKLRLTHD